MRCICGMLSTKLKVLNEIALEKKWQQFTTHTCCWTKNVNTQQQQNKKAKLNILVRPDN